MNDALFIASLACLLAAAVALVRFLPAQNAAFIILLLVAVEVAFDYWNGAGHLAEAAMFWPGAIILMRRAGQILLKPWRQRRNYGLLLIALPSGVTAGPPLILDSPERAAVRFCVTAVSLTLLTPWFLQKRVTFSGEAKK
ncbi:MAG TPA: hypothetical protein VMR33_10625 [Candidatus Baltobacteraceae bacterium]|nr:hypothetical protein [Candidatus Baltobacteraceae bacterium]